MKSLHLAGPEDLGRLVTLVSAFHSEQRLEVDYATVEAALTPDVVTRVIEIGRASCRERV